MLIDLIESERSALAAALHDGPLQLLASAALALDVADGESSEAVEAIRRAAEELRRMMSELSPLQLGPEYIAEVIAARLTARLRPSATIAVAATPDVATATSRRAALAAIRLIEMIVAPSTRAVAVSLSIETGRADESVPAHLVVVLAVEDDAVLTVSGRSLAFAEGVGAELEVGVRAVRMSVPT